jgi:S-adenosylmethionine decarboxylase
MKQIFSIILIGLVVLAIAFFSIFFIAHEAHAFEASNKSYHLVVELNRCNNKKLDNKDYLEKIMTDAVKLAEFNPIGTLFHQFEPQGVTGIVVLSESHLSIHTWPEKKYAALDLFTCGEKSPELAMHYIEEKLECKKYEAMMLERQNGIDVMYHVEKGK